MPATTLLHNDLNATLDIQLSARASSSTVVLATPRRESCPSLGIGSPWLPLRDDVGSVALGTDFVEAHAEAAGYSTASHSAVSASPADRATASFLFVGQHAPRIPGIASQAPTHVAEGAAERHSSKPVDEQRLLVIPRGCGRQGGRGAGGTVGAVVLLLVPRDVVTQRRGKAGGRGHR